MAGRRSNVVERQSYSQNRPPYFARGTFQTSQIDEYHKIRGSKSNEVLGQHLQTQRCWGPTRSETFGSYTGQNKTHRAPNDDVEGRQGTERFFHQHQNLSPQYFSQSSTAETITVSNTSSNPNFSTDSGQISHQSILNPRSTHGEMTPSYQNSMNNQVARLLPPQFTNLLSQPRAAVDLNPPVNLGANTLLQSGLQQQRQPTDNLPSQMSNTSAMLTPLWKSQFVTPSQFPDHVIPPNRMSNISTIPVNPPQFNHASTSIQPPNALPTVNSLNCSPNIVPVPLPQSQHAQLLPGNQLLSNNEIKNVVIPTPQIPTVGSSTISSFHSGKKEGQQEQKFKDIDWMKKFLVDRNLEKKKQTIKPPELDMKIYQAKMLLEEWNTLLDELSKQTTKMKTMEIVGVEKTLLSQELKKANVLRDRIIQLQTQFSNHTVMEALKYKLEQRRKKRACWKRMRSHQYCLRTEGEKNRIQLHHKIDLWREKVIAADQAKLRAQAMKSEAGGALGEVRRKLAEAHKALESIKALKKLREIRLQEAKVQGVFSVPTEEASKRFNKKIDCLEKLLVKQEQIYVTEERTLKVMMEEEEEEKDMETRKKFRHEMQQHGQSQAITKYDPMDELKRFYNQAELSLGSLLHVRRQWDAYNVPEVVAGSSRIPDGWVIPSEPSSLFWASALQEKTE